MKKDKLEQFILENKTAFDDAVPSMENWMAIESQLDQEESRKTAIVRPMLIRRSLAIAAAIALLLFVGGMIGRQLTIREMASVVEQSILFPELQEAERYYEAQVAERMKVLVSHKEAAYVLPDLEELDNFLVELKKELEQTPEAMQETVISNIIRSYQAKLDILEQVLKHLNHSPIQNSERNEINI